MDPHRSSLSRRAFLGRLAAVGALGTGASSVLAACGGTESGGAPESLVVEASTCRGYDPESVPVRHSLGYVDRSSVAGQYCKNCRFYGAPASERCGTCQLIPGTSGNGPVSPGGYCRSWVAAAAPV